MLTDIIAIAAALVVGIIIGKWFWTPVWNWFLGLFGKGDNAKVG